ncbi:MAG: MucR family transcriptional regulator [Sphingomonadaceae bacterium]
MAEPETQNLTALTVDLLSAYVSNNIVASEDLAGLVQSTYAAIAKIDAPTDTAPPVPDHVPAVSIRKSLGSRDVIISLIDGKPYKTLKRHLSGHGLTVAEYRARYNLPASYPMVAPAYSEHRRNVAHKLGLGQRVKTSEAAPTAPETVEPPKKAEARKPAIAKPGKSNGATPPKGAAAQAAAPKPVIKVADAYLANLIDALELDSMPDMADHDRIRIFLPKRQKMMIVRARRFDLVERYRKRRIYMDQIRKQPGRYTMLFRTSMLPDLEGADWSGGSLIWSLWSGYLERDRTDLRQWAAEAGLQFRIIHTSGHAHRADLRRMAEAIAPGRLMPIHTHHPGQYAELYPAVEPLPNGLWMEV